MSCGARSEVDTIPLRIPMRLERRGGRNLIISPDARVPAPMKPELDETVIRPLDP